MIKAIPKVDWYVDRIAQQKRDPGIQHSFMACLASSLLILKGEIDPVWVMGTSGFAFRIWVSKLLCPSAMSVFDWASILPEAVEQNGFHARHLSRFWGEGDEEEERCEEARKAIISAVDQGIPAIAWDVANCEWGLIVGYNLETQEYQALTNEGWPEVQLPFSQLGQREIKILSVIIPGSPNERSRDVVIRRSLEIAVDHAEQREWLDRPDYQDGILAFELWASVLEQGQPSELKNAWYYAAHYYGARCYAHQYIQKIAGQDHSLRQAEGCYARVADHLKPVWETCAALNRLPGPVRADLAVNIREAGQAETEAINHIKEYLTR
jgi:hypothetical protein